VESRTGNAVECSGSIAKQIEYFSSIVRNPPVKSII
jgi:hypothetical protein